MKDRLDVDDQRSHGVSALVAKCLSDCVLVVGIGETTAAGRIRSNGASDCCKLLFFNCV